MMRNHWRLLIQQSSVLVSNIRWISPSNFRSPIRANVPSGKWRLGKLNHVAVAVPNLDKTSGFFQNVLHTKSISEPVRQEEHGLQTVTVGLENTKIELHSPLGEKSPIKNFLEKNSSGAIHHICFEVDNLDAAIQDVHRQNIRTLTARSEIGDHGKAVIYLHPKDCAGILIELQQA